MKKVMLVFGTRPEAIKMAPLVKEFQKHSDEFQTIVCVTGQHREMLDQVLHIFDIAPDYDLNIMKLGQDLYDVTSRVLLGMRDVLKEAQPDVVLVHGDTTTSTAAALAAFYQQIAVGHVEAGLRTRNIYSPWPEEMNRQLTGRIATYHFAPTQLSRQNLLSEGVDENRVVVTGNTVIDALYMVVEKIKGDKALDCELHAVIQLVSRRRRSLSYVADIYSNRMPVSCTMQNFQLAMVSGIQNTKLSADERINVAEDCTDVLSAFLTVSDYSVEQSKIRAEVGIDVVYRDTNSLLSSVHRPGI